MMNEEQNCSNNNSLNEQYDDDDDLPNHFTDDEILTGVNMTIFNMISEFNHANKYHLTCGLVVRVRNGIDRLIKRTKLNYLEKKIPESDLLFQICFLFTRDKISLKEWNSEGLWRASEEIITKSINLSPHLQKLLYQHHFSRSKNHNGSLVHFSSSFLSQVKEYHEKVSRPPGTFSSEELECDELIFKLSQLPREVCRLCNGKRHIYCGDCGGIRLPSADCILPPRVNLPFHLLLIVHWCVHKFD
jgi:hypothetical protein